MAEISGPCCVLVLPGFPHRSTNEDRDLAVEALLAAPGQSLRRAAAPAQRLAGAVGLFQDDGAALRRIDVAEITWFDLKLATNETLLERFALGFSLLWYWLLAPAAWPAVRNSRVSAAGLAIAAIGLILWFLALLAVGLDGVTKAFGSVFGDETLPAWLRAMAAAVAPIGGLALLALAWASGSPAFEALPRFTRDWLVNAPRGRGLGLRQRVRGRVLGRIDEARDAGYARIVVVAHSLGAAFLVDALASARHAAELEVVTLGAPVGFLAARHPPLGEALAALLQADPPRAWLDLHAPSDFLSGALPGHRERYGAASSLAMRFPAARSTDRWLQRTHDMYWRDDESVRAIAARVLALPGSAVPP